MRATRGQFIVWGGNGDYGRVLARFTDRCEDNYPDTSYPEVYTIKTADDRVFEISESEVHQVLSSSLEGENLLKDGSLSGDRIDVIIFFAQVFGYRDGTEKLNDLKGARSDGRVIFEVSGQEFDITDGLEDFFGAGDAVVITKSMIADRLKLREPIDESDHSTDLARQAFDAFARVEARILNLDLTPSGASDDLAALRKMAMVAHAHAIHNLRQSTSDIRALVHDNNWLRENCSEAHESVMTWPSAYLT